jgi:solute carrier family 25 thiamine pyrophosphate transporter 19
MIQALWKGNVPAEGLYLCYGAIQFLGYRSMSQFLSSPSFPIDLPSGMNSFVSGATAGTIATTTTYPLDLLRTRFAAAGREKVYPSLLDGIRQIKQKEGYPGFFRGLAAANLQVIPYMGLFFTSYEAFKPILSESHLPLDWMGSADGTAGILASVLSKSIVYPLDTVRKRLQVQGPSRARYVHSNIPEYKKGPLGTIRAIVLKEGVRGLYRGLTVALFKAAPASAVTLWTYERVMAGFIYFDTQASNKDVA